MKLAANQRALVGILCIFAGLCVFRAYHLYVTSFFVSDEYRYTRDAFSGTFVEGGVSTRFVFTTMNAFLFNILHIRTTDAFVIFLPFYLFSWISISIFFFYKIMKLLEFDDKTITLSLISSLVLVAFTLLSVGFLSESFALAMATVGTYYLLWYIKRGGTGMSSLMAPLASILFFSLASFSREPYYLFLVGGTTVIIMANISKNKPLPMMAFSLAGSSLATAYLFVSGLILGWGPILLVFMSAGLLVMVAKKQFILLSVCLIALGSYLSVAYLSVAGLPPPTPTTPLYPDNYLSFQHFSTVIRFTDTAIPAFFIAAPFAFSYVSRYKKLIYLSIISFLLFGVGGIGLYQSYASSNLGLQQNPFSLNYRSGGAMVRDYIIANPQAAPFHIVGFWTATWYETTGTSQVDNRTLDFWMNMSQKQFIQQHWMTFYIYGYNLRYPNQTAHSLNYGNSSELLNSLIYPPTSSYPDAYVQYPILPFYVVDRTMIANATAFLIKFDIIWKD